MLELQVSRGFQRHLRKSGLTDPWQPLYSIIVDQTRRDMGLPFGPNHCNSLGSVHGAPITGPTVHSPNLKCAMTLLADRRSSNNGLVARSPNSNFLGTTELQECLHIEPEAIKAGGAICFARGLIRSFAQIVARAPATLKIR